MKKLSTKIPIRFNDIDAMGHVNNAVYLSYFEQARMVFFTHLLGSDWDWSAMGILLVRNEIDYILPVVLQDDLEADVWIDKIGSKSMHMHYELYTVNAGSRRLHTSGKSIIVCYDYRQKMSVVVPDAWKKAMSDLH